jgi:hypothetical protein
MEHPVKTYGFSMENYVSPSIYHGQQECSPSGTSTEKKEC